MKEYRFASVTNEDGKWRVDIYAAVRPISGRLLELGDVDRFLADFEVDEVMKDERRPKND